MRILTLLLGLFLISPAVQAQETKNVLFLGNSYTAANDLPFLVSQMAENTGKTLQYDSHTPGGARFMDHATSQVSLDKINSDNWDRVVLQGQSQETAFPDMQLEEEVYPYAADLVAAIRANDSCSIPVFYMTWGRKNGDPINCEFAPWFCNYEDMDDRIRSTYMTMAEENNAQVSPAGAVWRYLRTEHPEIELYASDGSHPSPAGSYAAASSFYTLIYGKTLKKCHGTTHYRKMMPRISGWRQRPLFLTRSLTGISP